ncbi:MAG TPA: hypothetical protein VHF89_05840 [Solirubrobacteraceae bacterium]|nr:hypothetical protein [Solirubrobacteraceae bacterium]
MSSSKDNGGGGLSLPTLVIASLSSLAAALFIHKFWQAGAILGAAVTPVIVALVSEALRKPVDVISARTGRTTVNPPPVVEPREDQFGIWEEQRRRPLHLKIALATGVVAFLIAAFFLTGAELVLGGASDSDRFRYVPGNQEQRDSRRERDAPARTEPDQARPAQPDEDDEEEPPPTVTVTTPAPETTPPPEEEEQEPPPAETAPPAPGATTPLP